MERNEEKARWDWKSKKGKKESGIRKGGYTMHTGTFVYNTCDDYVCLGLERERPSWKVDKMPEGKQKGKKSTFLDTH